MEWFFIGLVVLLVILIAANIRIVPQSESYVIERLGAYKHTWSVGVHLMMPIIDKIINRISMKEIVVNFQPQPVITKDNITMAIDTALFYQVTDPKLFTYGVHNPIFAIENLSTTALRNIIGELELDETLTSRDIINNKMRSILDEATNRWGIKVNRVEVKNIVPPQDIQDTMEKQMRAERERREAILKAEGEKKSAILVAEGQKQARILEAEGDKISTILRAEASKEAAIRAAEGEAEAIYQVQKATAEGLKLINEAAPSQGALTLKSLEAFTAAANGQATKIIIPSEIQGIAGLSASIQGILNDKK